MLRILLILLVSVGALYLLLLAVITVSQRSLLYFPGHDDTPTTLTEWKVDGRLLGFAREVSRPRMVWLMLHGNGGQASGREYVLPCLTASDSLYVLEYPGYGRRTGKPTRTSIDTAAQEAYRQLRRQFPGVPVGVIGESLGSGPACMLAKERQPPDKIALVVPYDTLPEVAAEHFPFLPAALLLFDRWDNIASLKGYRGKVEIFGARNDTIIPMHHARNLAKAVPGSIFHEIPGEHNGWASTGIVLSHDPRGSAIQRR